MSLSRFFPLLKINKKALLTHEIILTKRKKKKGLCNLLSIFSGLLLSQGFQQICLLQAGSQDFMCS